MDYNLLIDIQYITFYQKKCEHNWIDISKMKCWTLQDCQQLRLQVQKMKNVDFQSSSWNLVGSFGFIRSMKSHVHCSLRIHGFFSSQVCDEWCPFRPGSFFKSHHQESQFNTAQSWQEVQLQEESGWGRFKKMIACQDALTKTLYTLENERLLNT